MYRSNALTESPFNARNAGIVTSIPYRIRPRLLMVDDDAGFCLLLRHALDTAHYDISEVSTGRAAVRSLIDNKPDLVLLSIHLPDLDGITVLKQMRRIDKTTRILIMSMLNTPTWINEALVYGANGFLTKPFSLMTFRQSVGCFAHQEVMYGSR